MPLDPSALNSRQPVQLPIWPDAQRGVPNVIARSALFNVDRVRKGARANLKKAVIATVSGCEIQYTGEELRQDDEDVFLQALHLGQHHDLGSRVQFRARSMLKELSWSLNSKSQQRLSESLDRMKATALSIVTPQGGVTLSLIRKFWWRDDDSGELLKEWVLLLEPEIVKLFNPNAYTRLDWELRKQLPPLAKWLHAFYLSHAHPFPYKAETLMALSGSKNSTLRKFRWELRQALGSLVEKQFLEDAKVDENDLVVVRRVSSMRTL